MHQGADGVAEAVIAGAVRTPVGRHGGALSSVRPDDLGAHVLRAVADRAGVDLADVDDVYVGCANQAGEDNRDVARMSVLLADFPEIVPGVTVNRLCGSGLDAVARAARAIMVGDADVAIGSGVESMSRAPWVVPKAARAYATGPVEMAVDKAFAAQALAVLREWDVDPEDKRLIVNGGAIPLGHPLGASGARLVTTLVHEPERRAVVKAELERRGESTAAAARMATLATRRRKDYGVVPEQLVSGWSERAERLGFDRHALRALLARRAERQPVEWAEGVPQARFCRRLDAAPGDVRASRRPRGRLAGSGSI